MVFDTESVACTHGMNQEGVFASKFVHQDLLVVRSSMEEVRHVTSIIDKVFGKGQFRIKAKEEVTANRSNRPIPST